MKELIRRHYNTSFYVLTLLCSMLLLALHFVFPSAGSYSVSFTQLSPAVAVVLISVILKDKTILNEIRKKLLFDKADAKWILPAVFIPSICIAVSGFILSYQKIPHVLWEGDGLFYVLSFSAILLGCLAEETGWRGFLLPDLQKKYSPFTSSLIVGILWGVWHLNFTAGIAGFILYTITIMEMSLLMTWLYNKSNGNLVLMTIWHFVFNITSHIFLWERFGLRLFAVEAIVFGALCLSIVIIERRTCFLIRSVGSPKI